VLDLFVNMGWKKCYISHHFQGKEEENIHTQLIFHGN